MRETERERERDRERESERERDARNKGTSAADPGLFGKTRV